LSRARGNKTIFDLDTVSFSDMPCPFLTTPANSMTSLKYLKEYLDPMASLSPHPFLPFLAGSQGTTLVGLFLSFPVEDLHDPVRDFFSHLLIPLLVDLSRKYADDPLPCTLDCVLRRGKPSPFYSTGPGLRSTFIGVFFYGVGVG